MELYNQFKQHLTGHILPFWKGLIDRENGGYYGGVDFDLKVDKQWEKGCILNSRILWFFASAAIALEDQSLLPYARQAYTYMADHCLDKRFGGVYWSTSYDGHTLDDSKHTYNQAFAIYALSAYARAANEPAALTKAYELFNLIETRCRDEHGYLEAFTRDFQPASNEKLSENGVMASRTMNTLLHVFEGYAGLYEADHHPAVGAALENILKIFMKHVYNPGKRRQEVFFDLDYHTLIDLHSYGHDIESSWLLDWGCSLLNNRELTDQLTPALMALAKEVYEKAYNGRCIANECEEGRVDQTRVWWVQGEGVVGFMNAWQHQPEKAEYMEAVGNIWTYIQTYLVDKRPGGEWFSDLDDTDTPASKKNIVEPWKCPYHNGRMCIEMMRRLRQ